MAHACFLKQFGTNRVIPAPYTAKAFYALTKKVLRDNQRGGGPAKPTPQMPYLNALVAGMLFFIVYVRYDSKQKKA